MAYFLHPEFFDWNRQLWHTGYAVYLSDLKWPFVFDRDNKKLGIFVSIVFISFHISLLSIFVSFSVILSPYHDILLLYYFLVLCLISPLLRISFLYKRWLNDVKQCLHYWTVLNFVCFFNCSLGEQQFLWSTTLCGLWIILVQALVGLHRQSISLKLGTQLYSFTG